MNQMRTFRKKDKTGMHQTTFFTKGTLVNGQPVKGRTVLRPGNTIYCDPSELGNAHHMNQFELVGGGALEAKKEADAVKTASLVLKKREKGRAYDIVNPANPGKPLNEKPLSRKKGEEMLAKLLTEGQTPKVEGAADDGLDDLEWDDLVEKMEEAGLEVLDEYESDDDLREALRNASDEEEEEEEEEEDE